MDTALALSSLGLSCHRGCGGVVIEDYCIHPFRLGIEVQYGEPQLRLMV
ncbi:protein of unknown function [Limnospira indica PCC 8005]|uniref:Uncharacterized protein n=1 Tax=Limnospira indica PCC 8005 TaxID=376219 RepID=A0A9P1KDI0_9CYAN|nr:protein of unknown function [Limnospira indica PCC 8005]